MLLTNLTFQEERMGPPSPALVTRITGIWLVGYCAFYFCGPFIGGFLNDYFSYSSKSDVEVPSS